MSPIVIMNVLDRIESKALELYGRYGVKAITMDDISRACGISKKTLYENYANKKELVDDVITKLTGNLKIHYSFSVTHANDAVAEVLFSLVSIEQFFRKVNYIMVEDLEKHYYETWKTYLKFRDKIGLGLIKDNINRGIEEGVYHDEFKVDIIAEMRLRQLIQIHENAYYNDSLKETLNQVSRHYVAGLSTIKGRRLLKKYITEQK